MQKKAGGVYNNVILCKNGEHLQFGPVDKGRLSRIVTELPLRQPGGNSFIAFHPDDEWCPL